MSRAPIPSAFYALVVARWEDQFLLIQERSGQQPWYLPAGRVEAGESLEEGALREGLEESGISLTLTGVLAVEHTALPKRSRLRVVYTAEPAGDPTPLAFPGNEHAVQAAWVTPTEAARLPLRDAEVLHWFARARSGPVAPLALLNTMAMI